MVILFSTTYVKKYIVINYVDTYLKLLFGEAESWPLWLNYFYEEKFVLADRSAMASNRGVPWHFFTTYVQNSIVINWVHKYWHQMFGNLDESLVDSTSSCLRVHMCLPMVEMWPKTGESLGFLFLDNNCSSVHFHQLCCQLLKSDVWKGGLFNHWGSYGIKQENPLGMFSWQMIFNFNGLQLGDLWFKSVIHYFGLIIIFFLGVFFKLQS